MTAPAAEPADRLRSALRRHGLVRRPRALRRFLRRQKLHFSHGNKLTLFTTGDLGLAAMLAAIESAQQRIHLETYILRGDTTGRRFLAALAARARDGVAVRVIYDSVGSLTLDPAVLEDLHESGGEIIAFNPLRRFYPRWLPRRRDHRKILVVDGQVAFTGGLNIGDEYNFGPDASERTWRDTHVQLEGPAVRELDALFLESWFRADGSDLPWAWILDSAPAPCGRDRVAVVADGPSYRRRMIRDLLALGLRTAATEVMLTSPYFAPDRKVLGAIEHAARRGTRVRMLLAGYTDHPILRRAARALVPRLLDAGVQVHEYYSSMLHAKATVIDDHWAIVGTSNIDRQSFEHSYEVNLVVEGGAVPAALAAHFRADVARATPVDADRLAGRGLIERALDRLSALVLRII